LGVGQNAPTDADFDVSRNAVRAREAANAELCKQLETNPVKAPEPQPQAASGAAVSPQASS
jgi:hypothetical protein